MIYMGYLPRGYLPRNKRNIFHSELNFSSNEPLLYQLLQLRKDKNKDSIVVVVGEKRSGKSYFCMKTAEDLAIKWGIKFDVDNVFYEIEDLLKFMYNNKDSIGIVEEAGFFLNAQEWASIENKIVRNMTQTQGFRRNIIFFNLPHFAFLNKTMRLMTNFGIETIGRGKVVVKKVNPNYLEGDGYFTKLETIEFVLPSKELVERYEEKKKIYNDVWIQQDIEYFQLLSGEKKLPEKIKPIRPLPTSAVVNLFKNKKIEKEEALSELVSHGYDLGRAEKLLLVSPITNKKSPLDKLFANP